MFKRFGAVLGLVAVLSVLTAGSANAAVDPDTVTAITGGFTDLKTMLTANLIPALIGVVLVGLGLAVGLKYLGKARSKA